MHFSEDVEKASWLRRSVPTLNLIVKNHEESERSFIQCRPFSKQQKWLKCLPLEELESALAADFKQACGNNASTDGIHLKEKGLHISAHVEMANFLASNGCISRFKRWRMSYTSLNVWKQPNLWLLVVGSADLTGESRSVDSVTIEEWKNYQLLQ
jgi:hypothetical protein